MKRATFWFMSQTRTAAQISEAVIAAYPTMAAHHVVNITRTAIQMFDEIGDEFDTVEQGVAEVVKVTGAEYHAYLANLV